MGEGEPAAVAKCRKKIGKISVKAEFKKNMPFLSRHSMKYIHNSLEKGTTRAVIRKYITEKYPEEAKQRLGEGRKAQKTVDNMVRILSGRKGLRIPVIYQSEKRYPDPAKGGKGTTGWLAFDKATAERAGQLYEGMLKRESQARREQELERREIDRYKNRLLNRTKELKRLAGERHEEIAQRALEEVVNEFMSKGGMDKQDVMKALNVDNGIKRDLLDMDRINERVKNNMKEFEAMEIKNDLKDLNKKFTGPGGYHEATKSNNKVLNKAQIEFVRDGHFRYEINKAWEEKLKAAMERRSASFLY